MPPISVRTVKIAKIYTGPVCGCAPLSHLSGFFPALLVKERSWFLDTKRGKETLIHILTTNYIRAYSFRPSRISIILGTGTILKLLPPTTTTTKTTTTIPITKSDDDKRLR